MFYLGWKERKFCRNHRLSQGVIFMINKISNIHPGEILQEDFLTPLNLSQYRIAKDICVPPRRINEIVHGKRAITADTALRFSKYFGTTPQFWLNLQTHYELENEKERSLELIDRQVHQLRKAA
jgi:addiction module HigA family antidote